ncbi:MAG: hypothetical protein F4X64_08965 [Chloroflexi bacterium]|nr:hypothetical protein [Chloroflexota bacterium]
MAFAPSDTGVAWRVKRHLQLGRWRQIKLGRASGGPVGFRAPARCRPEAGAPLPPPTGAPPDQLTVFARQSWEEQATLIASHPSP